MIESGRVYPIGDGSIAGWRDLQQCCGRIAGYYHIGLIVLRSRGTARRDPRMFTLCTVACGLIGRVSACILLCIFLCVGVQEGEEAPRTTEGGRPNARIKFHKRSRQAGELQIVGDVDAILTRLYGAHKAHQHRSGYKKISHMHSPYGRAELKSTTYLHARSPSGRSGLARLETLGCGRPQPHGHSASRWAFCRHSPDDPELRRKILHFRRGRKSERRLRAGARTFLGEAGPKGPGWLDFLDIRTHSCRRDDALHRPRSYDGAARGRSPSIRLRISANSARGTATSAIWKIT